MPKSKDAHSNKHGYSWYTEEQLDEYYNKLIGMIQQILNITLHFLSINSFSGEHADTLKGQCFTDSEKTNCLEAVKFVANLVWNGEAVFTFASLLVVEGQSRLNTLLLRVPGKEGPQPP